MMEKFYVNEGGVVRTTNGPELSTSDVVYLLNAAVRQDTKIGKLEKKLNLVRPDARRFVALAGAFIKTDPVFEAKMAESCAEDIHAIRALIDAATEHSASCNQPTLRDFIDDGNVEPKSFRCGMCDSSFVGRKHRTVCKVCEETIIKNKS